MAESSWPTIAGGRAVSEIQYELMAAGYAANGVIGSPTDPPTVYADSTGMQVKVRANKTALVGGEGWTSGPTEFTKAIGAAPAGSTRIDLVVLRLTRSTRVVTTEVRAGVAGSGVAPTPVQDSAISGAGIFEVPIATVTVGPSVTTINAGNVATVAKYIGPGASGARPKVYNLLPPDSVNLAFTNTAAPTADLVNSTGMFSVSASRLTLDKQSPDSAIEVGLKFTGIPNTPMRVVGGVRVMGTGYTSTNFVVAMQHANLPQYVGVDFSAYLTTDTGDGRHWHNIGQHNHGVSLPSIHYRADGLIHITGLAVRTYTLQPFVYVSTGSFAMDTNDMLSFRVQEV